MNISGSEAERQLWDKTVGECIIRPGPNLSTLFGSWLFQPGIVKHFEIEEGGKDDNDPSQLGNELRIRGIDESFDDLDDLLANYIGPMNDHVKAMLAFRYFQNDATFEEVEHSMREVKRQSPKKVPFHTVRDPQ